MGRHVLPLPGKDHQRIDRDDLLRPLHGATHPGEHCVVHALPLAPQFVGREHELDLLRRSGEMAREASSLLSVWEEQARPPSRRNFSKSWSRASSFRDPRACLFGASITSLTPATSCRSCTGISHPSTKLRHRPRGRRVLHLLRNALEKGGPHLLVLDGLERVQRQGESATEAFGQIEDPLLKGLLTRIAEGVGQTVAWRHEPFSARGSQFISGRRLPVYRRRAVQS